MLHCTNAAALSV